MDDLTTAQASLQDRAKQVLPAGGFGNFDPSIFIASGEGALSMTVMVIDMLII